MAVYDVGLLTVKSFFWSGRYQVVTTWMGDSADIKSSRYITNTKVNSAFRPSAVGKSSTGLHGCG